MSEKETELTRLLVLERAALRAKDHESADTLRAQMMDLVSQCPLDEQALSRSVASARQERLAGAGGPTGADARLRARAGLAIVPGSVEQRPAPPESHVTPEMDTSWLPAPMRDWCEAMSAATCAPRNLPVAAALCAVATALQGRVKVRWKEGVDEPLCLSWFVFSGTGTRKTTIQSAATRAIAAYEREQAEAVERENKITDNKRRWKEAQLSSLRRRKMPDDKRGSAYTDLHGKIHELQKDLEELVMRVSPVWLQDDVNPSLLPKLMDRNQQADGHARISVMVSEGTFLKNLLGRHQGQPILESVLGALNGEPIRIVRASKDSDGIVETRLEAAYITMCQFLQPHLLAELRRTDMSDTGFIGRSIVDVLPAEPIKPPWDAPPVPEAIQDAWDALLRALITEEVTDMVDLTLDPVTANCVRAIYEAVELDDTGTCQRITGIVCRLVALTEVVQDVLTRQTCPQKPRVKSLPQVAGQSQVYDWVDELDEKQESAPSAPCPGGSGARAVREKLKKVASLLYTQRLPALRDLDTPSQPVGSLAATLLRAPPQPGQGHGQIPGAVSVVAAWRSIPSRRRGTADAFYAALEELEQAGCIEWIPESMRRKGNVSRYRLFRFLVAPQPTHLTAVPAISKETNQ